MLIWRDAGGGGGGGEEDLKFSKDNRWLQSVNCSSNSLIGWMGRRATFFTKDLSRLGSHGVVPQEEVRQQQFEMIHIFKSNTTVCY